MIRIEIPGRDDLLLAHAVFDVNGTIACDGVLLPGVAERLQQLSAHLTLHMLTANTHGRQNGIDQALGFKATIVGQGAAAKTDFVRALGSSGVVAIGNGAIDEGMLKEAALGIAVLGPEGLANACLQAADVVVPSIIGGIDLLLYPRRLVATLRR